MKRKFLKILATRPDIELVEYLYDRMDTHAVRYSIAVSFCQDGKRIYDQWENSAIIVDGADVLNWKMFLLSDFREWIKDIITDDE